MSSALFSSDKNQKQETIQNKPTEIDNDIFRYFEYFQNFNNNSKSNTINSTNFWKKKVPQRKSNNMNSNLIGSLGPNINPNQNFYRDENININYENNLSKIHKFVHESKSIENKFWIEFDKKRKAKLALLMFMNKFSGGEYCKEVKIYFDNKKKFAEEKYNKDHMSKEEEIKKNFERQRCIESFDKKDITKFNTEKLSDKLSKINSEIEFMQNNQNINHFKFLNKSKLPKIIEENNDFYIKKKFINDLNEDQLANLYYAPEDIDKMNNIFISGKRHKKIKKEEIRNLLINTKMENSMAAMPGNFNKYFKDNINSQCNDDNNFNNHINNLNILNHHNHYNNIKNNHNNTKNFKNIQTNNYIINSQLKDHSDERTSKSHKKSFKILINNSQNIDYNRNPSKNNNKHNYLNDFNLNIKKCHFENKEKMNRNVVFDC